MKLRKEAKQLTIAYKFFETEDGKLILEDFRKLAVIMDGVIKVTDSFDPNRMFLLQGRSDVVKHIYMMLGKNPYSEREEHAISKQGE